MKKNATVLAVLLFMSTVPAILTFRFTDGDAAPKPAPAAPAPAASSDPSSSASASASGSGSSAVPVFKGYEKERYQEFDALIAEYVADYNAHRDKWAGATPEQGAKMPEITAAQIKAHMIQETGGGDVVSRAAWAKDPLQVNVPGDWNPYKKYLGLREPRKRNEGSLEQNLKAGIMLLSRKGYGVAGQPAGNRPQGTFDGWEPALKRYNGRSDKAADGRKYRDCYAERILERANKGEKTEVVIPIPTKKKK